MDKELKLIFYGGVGSATGANIMLRYGNKNILVDCGLLQSVGEERKNYEPFKYNPAEVDFLFITHAHMDHIGRVPKLVRDGFKGRIISTPETKELALPMLQDALRVMESKHPGGVIYEEKDIEKSLLLWENVGYYQIKEIFEGCSFKMINAGHILGSAIVEISCKTTDGEAKIAFTGDLGNSPSPLLPDTDFVKDVNYIVMESVYGDRNHESKKERKAKLKEALINGIKRGGSIIIPAFSIERTQVLLYEINNMVEGKEIPEVPVFFDSPLALKVTDIYKKHINDFKESVRREIKEGDNIFDFPNLHIVKSAEESKELEKIKDTKIILAGSGMSEGGRVVNHELASLPDPKATIMLVGYQSVGTLGRAIQDGKKEIEITPPAPFYLKRGEKRKKEIIKVRAKIENITGYSSHKDSEHLLEFVEKANTPPHPPLDQGREGKELKKVFVIMGEPKSSLFLCQRIRDYLNIEAVYPEEGKEYKLK